MSSRNEVGNHSRKIHSVGERDSFKEDSFKEDKMSLPLDIFEVISLFLHPRDISKLTLTCKDLYDRELYPPISQSLIYACKTNNKREVERLISLKVKSDEALLLSIKRRDKTMTSIIMKNHLHNPSYLDNEALFYCAINKIDPSNFIGKCSMNTRYDLRRISLDRRVSILGLCCIVDNYDLAMQVLQYIHTVDEEDIILAHQYNRTDIISSLIDFNFTSHSSILELFSSS